jgi:hypothetical protein
MSPYSSLAADTYSGQQTGSPVAVPTGAVNCTCNLVMNATDYETVGIQGPIAALVTTNGTTYLSRASALWESGPGSTDEDGNPIPGYIGFNLAGTESGVQPVVSLTNTANNSVPVYYGITVSFTDASGALL